MSRMSIVFTDVIAARRSSACSRVKVPVLGSTPSNANSSPVAGAANWRAASAGGASLSTMMFQYARNSSPKPAVFKPALTGGRTSVAVPWLAYGGMPAGSAAADRSRTAGVSMFGEIAMLTPLRATTPARGETGRSVMSVPRPSALRGKLKLVRSGSAVLNICAHRLRRTVRRASVVS